MRRRTLAVLLFAMGNGAAAADYPTRPITMMVPQNVSGADDIVGCIVAQKLGEVLGGGVVVENRPGAGGNIGAAQASMILSRSSSSFASPWDTPAKPQPS